MRVRLDASFAKRPYGSFCSLRSRRKKLLLFGMFFGLCLVTYLKWGRSPQAPNARLLRFCRLWLSAHSAPYSSAVHSKPKGAKALALWHYFIFL
ncbi:hypothetical protein CUS_5158 [Ruminococcus albus 8]|uniref:Uncharacterized protein n=1 Tax=Ruminococcus albus 8 TaxID=246199 RepID=E9S8P2_RUMAL|nr:hypothetical protein CUS_5158 [Ruminococcus albus 8]